MTRAIVLNPLDNVATLVDEGTRGGFAQLSGERSDRIELRADIPYGHKLAIAPVHVGDDILKYGQVIGRATTDVAVGDHVHIHNVEALRARGDRRA